MLHKSLGRLFLILFVVLSAAQVSAAEACKVCGMYVQLYRTTATQLEQTDKAPIETCGVACMLRLIDEAGGPAAFTAIRATDWKTGQLINAQSATYVIGSRVIPDMLPNIIAFASSQEARNFSAKEGGELLTFNQALRAISPMGMTMPTRITAAALPPKGSMGIGAGVMYMEMDTVKKGTDSIETRDLVKHQMMGPKEMSATGEMLMASYGITDNLAVGVKIPVLQKEMQMYAMGGNVVNTTKNDGLGDIDLSLRYGLWRNALYSQFCSLLFAAGLPTGDFDEQFRTMPGLQLGSEAFSVTSGLLYSFRKNDFWIHAMASHTARLENDDDYRFGDDTRLGAALHYTPNYDLMFGLEIDGTWYGKNEDRNKTIDNSGGFRSALSGIVDYRFFTALGGNFSLRAAAGIPLYEDLNHTSVAAMGSTSQLVQLGGGYFANLSISFKRRFAIY